jgi:hypothetical protein
VRNICTVFDFILHTTYTEDACALSRILPSLSLTVTTYCTADTNRRRRRFWVSISTFIFIWISLVHIDLKPIRSSRAIFGRILARNYGVLNVRCALLMRFYTSYISSFKTLFSILGHIMLCFGRIWVIVGVVKHPVSYPVSTKDIFPGCKAAEA